MFAALESRPRPLRRALALPAIALLLASPLACKPKAAPEIPIVDDEATTAKTPAPVQAEPEPEPPPPPSVHVRASVRELSEFFALVKEITAAWSGEAFDVSAQAQAILLQMGYGPGMWSSLDWSGVMAGDLHFPLAEDALPGDSRAFGTLAAQSPRAVLDAVPESRRPQPLGDGVWEMVDDNLRVLFREQGQALEFALVPSDLDQASSLVAPALAGRRLQVVANEFPEGWLSARDFVDLPEGNPQADRVAAVIEGASELRFEVDAGTDRDLQLHLGALAPFELLGLDPLGPPRTQPTALEGLLPGQPVAVFAQTWGSPALIHKAIDRSVPLDQLPEPFAKIARDAIAAAHALLDQVKSDVVLGLYLTKSGKAALLVAADVKDEVQAGAALKTVSKSVVSALESYRELAGGSPEAAFKVTYKPGGGNLGQGKGDLLRLGPPKNMAADLERFEFFLTKKGEVEVISGVHGGVAYMALGGGAGELWADKRAGALASDGGLAQARAASGGCQVCVGIDPVGVTRMMATVARDATADKKTEKEYVAVLRDLGKLGELGDVGLGFQAQAGKGALALGVPRSLLMPPPATTEKVRALFDRVWDAYFDGEPSERKVSERAR
ncbi:MAG: hypothetical protein R3A79_10695 [Nannocystaceae bacterium]